MNFTDILRIVPDIEVLIAVQNVAGGNPSTDGWLTRPLSTLLVNTIDGASFSAPQITLPSGKYMAMMGDGVARTDGTKTCIYNVTDAEYVMNANYGNMNFNNNDDGISTDISMSYCPFTLDGTTVIEHRTWCQDRNSSSYWGHYIDVEGTGTNQWNGFTKIVRYDNI